MIYREQVERASVAEFTVWWIGARSADKNVGDTADRNVCVTLQDYLALTGGVEMRFWTWLGAKVTAGLKPGLSM